MMMINVSVMLILMLSLISLPYMSSKDISFGIRIPRSEFANDDIKNIRKNFITVLSASGILGVIVVAMFGTNDLVTTSTYMIYLVITTLVFVNSHSKMKVLKMNSKWKIDDKQTIVVDTNFRKNNITINNAYFGINVLILIASYIILVVNEVVFSTDVIMMVFIEVFMIMLFLFVNRTIRYSRNNFSDKNTKEQIDKEVESKFVMSITLFMIGVIAQLTVVLSTITDIGLYDGTLMIYALMILQFIVIAYLIIKFIKLEKKDNTKNEKLEGNDDDLWRYGLFYCNKNDPAVFVKKRIGIGYTFNHARKSVFVFYAVLALIIVVSAVFGL